MDVGTLNRWDMAQVVSAAEIRGRIEAEFPLDPVPPQYEGEVATRFEYRDGSGEIGIISSVSAPFCGACSRARLTIEGQLVTCLFASRGTDLRGPLRDGESDEALSQRIAEVWGNRRDRYSEERAGLLEVRGPDRAISKIEMYQVGG